MRELSQILTAFEGLAAGGTPAAVATVVAVGGSSYRRPGARMLVVTDGRTWGGISGGCLERDVARRARGVIETGKPVLCRYDTTESLDDATESSGLLDLGRTPGVTLGCRGVIDLFIERITGESPGPIPFMAKAVRERVNVITGTLLRATGNVKSRPGARFRLDSDDVDNRDELRSLVAERLQREHGSNHGVVHHLVLAGNQSADVFIETIRPPQSLVIFGGGSDVVPLMELAKTLGWHVTIVAARSATAARERFATADVLAITEADDPAAGVAIEPDAAVVLMTHDFPRDAKILTTLAGHPLRYLGLLGPRSRAERLLGRAADASLWNAFYPVGLDVGADNPELIALAIASEIQAVLAGRPGGMLRGRPGPIYPRAGSPA